MSRVVVHRGVFRNLGLTEAEFREMAEGGMVEKVEDEKSYGALVDEEYKKTTMPLCNPMKVRDDGKVVKEYEELLREKAAVGGL